MTYTVFLNHSTIGIWGWIIFCCGKLSSAFISIRGFYPLDTNNDFKTPLDVVRCSLGQGKITPVDNQCFRAWQLSVPE